MGIPKNEISDETLTLSLRAGPDASARAARPPRERHVSRRPLPPRRPASPPPPPPRPRAPAVAARRSPRRRPSSAAARRPPAAAAPRAPPPTAAAPAPASSGVLLRRRALLRPGAAGPFFSSGERARTPARSDPEKSCVDFSRSQKSSKSFYFTLSAPIRDAITL